jgi:hypothetical protein
MHAPDALLRPGRAPFGNGPETNFLEPRGLRAYYYTNPIPLAFDSTEEKGKEKGTCYTILRICYIYVRILRIRANGRSLHIALDFSISHSSHLPTSSSLFLDVRY